MEDKLYPLQIAILGSSSDIATATELGLSAMLADYLARRGVTVLVGGSDGVMGAAAEAAKLAGGTVACILPDQKPLTDLAAAFDVIIRTRLPFGPASSPLIASADAAVLVGGGVGTLVEIAQAALYETPIAALCPSDELARVCGKWLDRRKFCRVHIVSNAQEAGDFALDAGFASRFGQKKASAALTQYSDRMLMAAYPYGVVGGLIYKRAANARQLAGATSDESCNAARAHLLQADFSYYSLAIDHAFGHAARAARDPGADANTQAFARAFACESAGYVLGEMELYDEAARLLRAAARLYCAMQNGATQVERALLQHSVAGCLASAVCNIACELAKRGRFSDAERRLVLAERLVIRAVRRNPRWSDNPTCDTRGHAEAEVVDARAKVKSMRSKQTCL